MNLSAFHYHPLNPDCLLTFVLQIVRRTVNSRGFHVNVRIAWNWTILDSIDSALKKWIDFILVSFVELMAPHTNAVIIILRVERWIILWQMLMCLELSVCFISNNYMSIILLMFLFLIIKYCKYKFYNTWDFLMMHI